MAIIYITMEQAVSTHRLTIDKSGGGAHGALEVEKLDAVLQHIQNDDYYPTFDAKLTHLFHSACNFTVSKMATNTSPSPSVRKCC